MSRDCGSSARAAQPRAADVIRLPANFDSISLTDWVEVELLFGSHTELSQTEMLGLLTDDLGAAEQFDMVDGNIEQAPAAGEDSSALQLQLENVWLLLDERAARAGSAYPFSTSGLKVVATGGWQAHLEYAFLALLSARFLLGLANDIPTHTPAVLFEKLVKTALKNWLNGRSARFGWPLEGEFVGTIHERIAHLAKLMNERPHPELTTVTTDQKDHGLDVVAWVPLDHRASQVIVLCQCGIGRDFAEKVLPTGRWPSVIDFLAPPLTALAVPFEDFGAGEAGTHWRSLAKDAGILFDRTRIARFASVADEPDLEARITDWISQVLPVFATA